ncbi:MAG TPA: hypothetical protein VIG24_14075 [Acidimicrobiia bacterium]
MSDPRHIARRAAARCAENTRRRRVEYLRESLAAVKAGNLDRLGDVVRFCRLLDLDPDEVLAHPSMQ